MKTITLGIDMDSRPKTTAACRIVWEAGRAIASSPITRCDDDMLDEWIVSADAVGIDAPFGWPIEFAKSVGGWDFTAWDDDLRKRLCFRETDRLVHKTLNIWPLSVSSDRIALPVMRTFSLLKRQEVTDLSGDGQFYEVYSAGSLSMWKLPSRNYKQVTAEHAKNRLEILRSIRRILPWLEADDVFAETGDTLDALIASLTARASIQEKTIKPDSSQKHWAVREGWIHIPTDLPS